MPASVEDWWRPFRTIGAIGIAHVDLAPDALREAEAFAWLGADEQERGRGYRHPGVRRRFSLCRAALRGLLTERLACANEHLSFGVSPHGKPYALVRGAPAPVSFNVSHSGAHGLIAVAPSGRVGVDVEERATRHDLDGPIADVLGPDERKELAAACGQRKLHLFFYYWTIKEALIKALGTGHRTDVSQVQTPSNMRGGEPVGVFRFPHMPGVAWGVEDIGAEDFAAAVAYELEPGACAAR